MKRLLVTLDGSAESEAVIPVAADLARSAGMEVHLLRVAEIPEATRVTDGRAVDPYRARYREPLLAAALPDPGPRPAEYRDQSIERAEYETLEYLQDRARQFGDLPVEMHVRLDGDAPAAIIDTARKLDASLLAMATHGRGALGSLVQGSVAQEVVKSGVAPVVLVRPELLQG